jgi:MoCo/4Fe-4S cofactor protein with predicted Tat translocation signal
MSENKDSSNSASDSNLNLDSIRAKLEQAKGPGYWRSLDELTSLDGFKEFLHREFPRQASEWIDDEARRNFLKIMGASLALAGISACTRQPTEYIMPYVEPPEQQIPGKPLFYATAFPVSGIANPVLVETHEFRPTKVEGNPEHPSSMGGTDVPTQASILGLYDPDRLQAVNFIGEIRSYASFLQNFIGALQKQKTKNGSGIRILTETVASPTLHSQIQEVLRLYPGAKWLQWEPTGQGRRMGTQMAFGQFLNPVYRFDRAEVVFSIDANFLGNGPGGVRYARDFTSKRTLRGGVRTMSRFYAVETTPTSTGCKADHRQPVRPSEVAPFVHSLASALGGATQPAAQTGGLAGSKFFQTLVKDLGANRGKSIVIAGDDQSPEVHAVAHYINQLLGNNGSTIVFTSPLEPKPADQWADLQSLVQDLNAGQVDLLLMIGGNPVYTAPPEMNIRGAIQKAALRVRLSMYEDETAEVCQWNIPEAHAYEQWSDAPAHDGTMSIIQPMIAPLYGGKSAHEVLAAFTDTPEKSGYELVREYWRTKHTGADFETWWRHSVHDGFIRGTALPAVSATAKSITPQAAPAGGSSGYEVSFHCDPYILDGRYANNAWLQELPRPVSRLTWDNAVIVSPKTADELKVADEDRVAIELNGRTVWGAVWRIPGHPDGSIGLSLGYGRRRSGRAGNGAGFDVYPLRSAANPYFAQGAKVTKVGGTFRLAAVQHHFAMEGREPIHAGTLDELNQDPYFSQRRSELPPKGLTIFPETFKYQGYAWGMAIDLNSCVACNACVVACQSENNIPVVGKTQVLNTREMHWIRIDRYYKGDPNEPQMHFQPVACVQCEDAPCEIVCPVAATETDAEGLNNMVYNRCVGTRYCSNNCPYKVRRFNFLLFSDWDTESVKLQRNPDVTVRSRGVMEKCTYCVQRINYAKITAEKEDRKVRDGEIIPACAAACPSQAIMFGDLNDPDSRVSQWKRESLNYSLLAELNTRPRTTYITEIRNPHPDLKQVEKES